mmetsp:Transcript_91082/g.253599  ORF Transcript_91082/g.253599 Transcript_91082/m.253599 type:complete len:209 (-) Transcript_91082:238-864(-)|eukprot:CAMPEP_0179113708 /NCGR_PEP_ID=MMETSP0796-20121207/53211_1 /TAXON_ID=73915 /ORGANISM="Pyrodinium bahamense, Strain pbaha01" /LENGTH=208 /DNA_ID=CAMNT_0020811911 /DNA_START=91 /DNA_END=717 /DNA_ORIENTATION=-
MPQLEGAPPEPEPQAHPKPGYGWNKWEVPPQGMSTYEQKMMRRIERASRRAVGEVEAGAHTRQSKSAAGRPLRPPPADGPDHDKLFHLAREARDRGDMFFYFPEAGDRLKMDAARLDRICKEAEKGDEETRRRNAEQPEKGLYDFFERLEEMQQEARSQNLETGEVEGLRPQPGPDPLVASAGRRPGVVVEAGPDEGGAGAGARRGSE